MSNQTINNDENDDAKHDLLTLELYAAIRSCNHEQLQRAIDLLRSGELAELAEHCPTLATNEKLPDFLDALQELIDANVL